MPTKRGDKDASEGLSVSSQEVYNAKGLSLGRLLWQVSLNLKAPLALRVRVCLSSP